MGEPVPVYPEWAHSYEVVADDQAEEAQRRRRFLERAMAAYRRGPRVLIPHLAGLGDSDDFRVDDPSTSSLQ